MTKMNVVHTVVEGLDRIAKLNGERDNVARRLGTAEGSLIVALNYVLAHLGEDIARDLAKALSFEVVEKTEEKV